MKNLYLVDIEFRYSDWNDDEERSSCRNKTVTIGIFDTYEEAVKAGNEMLETKLETKFQLNKNWNKKNRFGEKYTKNLISDLAYLETPFEFFAHIKKLELSPVEDTIIEVMRARERYIEGKKKLSED